MNPQVPIAVDEATGEWTVDGVPMILVPRHFFLNNHHAVESALGVDSYSKILFAAGHKSAYVWCEKEAKTHGLKGVEVFHHYMKRLSQRGWGQFTVEARVLWAEHSHAQPRAAPNHFSPFLVLIWIECFPEHPTSPHRPAIMD